LIITSRNKTSWIKKQNDADKRSPMVKKEKSKEKKRRLVSRPIKIFTAEITGK